MDAMKRWEKESVMDNHPQEHQVLVLLKMGIGLLLLQI